MNARVGIHFQTQRPVRIEWESDRIASLQEVGPPSTDTELPILCPGFFDVQINGLAGVNFGNPDLKLDDLRTVARHLNSYGVTQFLPTLITDDIQRMQASASRLADAANDDALKPMLRGIHFEGPYLSPQDGARGAHPLEHCRQPNWDEFARMQDAAQGLIRVMTLAPELSGSIDFIRRLTRTGVRVAIGHTSATRDQILAAVDAGATLATHLGNAVQDQIQRHHNTIFDQLGEDRLWASLIVDGHHLPSHVVKIFLRAKGLQRTILVSDAVQYAGLQPGIYDAGYRAFEVRDDGFIGVVGEPRLAGSGLLLHKGVQNLVRFTGVTLADAIATVTENPARWLGIDDSIGSLKPGLQANLLLLRSNQTADTLEIAETILAGTTVYRRNGERAT